jgi:hypothetical protein
MLDGYITRYHRILANRLRRFEQTGTHNNFVRARASFDEGFATTIGRDLKYHTVPRRAYTFFLSELTKRVSSPFGLSTYFEISP